ncbi:MAG: NAD-dependent epimerase/dehydratase family protein [Lachnospiraceae bacterium]|nr:NAD-dependent epimerase/dehydratase family protein [Lachnospiraceae bacterium]
MKILVTGAKGFVGKNLVETLKCVRDGKKRDTSILVDEIFEYDKDNTLEDLNRFCNNCNFVFNLAGVNRPKDVAEFDVGNYGFAEILLDCLKSHGNTCPVMLSSSIQASLNGRYADSPYGKSKLAGEELFFKYSEETGAKVLVYRFPNIFGKWCRPNYNSAIATFCNAIANNLEYTVNDRSTELSLLYIDDLINEMLYALEGKEHHCDYSAYPSMSVERYSPFENKNGRYCYVPAEHKATLGYIVDLLESFATQPNTLLFDSIPEGSFAKKLYSTYLSYLPAAKTIFSLAGTTDNRGSFTEFFRNKDVGQFSINVSKPGMTKGQHWHHTKMEIFLVVSGHGLIQERQIGINPETGKEYPVREFEVSGSKLQCVYMLPGYTHNIINLSDTDDMVTVMWANEIFDPEHPETYHERV